MLTNIMAASYSLASLAFLPFSLFLWIRRRSRPHAGALAAACLLTAAWAGAAAAAAMGAPSLLGLTDVLEILRGTAWAFFLLSALGQLRNERGETSAPGKLPAAAIGGFCLLLLGATAGLRVIPALAAGASGFLIIIVGRAVMAVVNMLLVEQLYRNSAHEDRWAIKFACLGIGGLFAYDFYLYSDAMLFRRINAEIWAARGLVNALTVPLIALSAKRNPRWSHGIAVSRAVLFHSVALIGSAVYLLAMAAAGYYLRLFGGSWGTVMQVAFLFGTGILLFAALFSGSARAWLRVFISKHFYRYRYDYREEWIRFTRALSDAGDGLNERTIQAIAKPMESPSGALFLRKEESGCCEPVTHWNMPATRQAEPLQGALCSYLANTQWVIDLQEYQACPEKYEGLALPGWLAQMGDAWLVVPLLLERRLFGFVVLGRPRSKMKLNWEALDLLKIVGTQAASYLAQRESQHALMVARQFESYTRMSTFIVHDLKNLISQLSLVLANAERHKDNREFQADMLETVDLSVKKMKLLLQKLGRENATDRP
ncbi:MAG: XrtA/PEP-CTERM system histidine kinase PrsK, partial [Bacillota bacterium]